MTDVEYPNSRRKTLFQFSLRGLVWMIVLASLILGAYMQWKKYDFKFEEYDDYYQVEMLEKIRFLDHHCHVYVVLEEGETAPTFRQRKLIYQLQQYDSALTEIIDDAADEHRIDYEGAVGDLTKEYGLPVMNRQNISQFYGVGGIEIPRLNDSPDQFIVLGCYCVWEEEHGMEILIKNGSSAPWHGTEGPWQWRTPTEFLLGLKKD